MTACEPGATIDFVNETNKAVCFYSVEGDFEECLEIGPNVTDRHITKACGTNDNSLVLLTANGSREYFYQQEAPCRDWDDVTITISESGGRLAATDTLDQ